MNLEMLQWVQTTDYNDRQFAVSKSFLWLLQLVSETKQKSSIIAQLLDIKNCTIREYIIYIHT